MDQLLRRRDLDHLLTNLDQPNSLDTTEQDILTPAEIENLVIERINLHRSRWALLVLELDGQKRLHPQDREQLLIEASMWRQELSS